VGHPGYVLDFRGGRDFGEGQVKAVVLTQERRNNSAPQDKDLIMQLAQPFRFILSIQLKRASLKIENVARKFFFLFFLGNRSRD
jgi:hypothetical protein